MVWFIYLGKHSRVLWWHILPNTWIWISTSPLLSTIFVLLHNSLEKPRAEKERSREGGGGGSSSDLPPEGGDTVMEEPPAVSQLLLLLPNATSPLFPFSLCHPHISPLPLTPSANPYCLAGSVSSDVFQRSLLRFRRSSLILRFVPFVFFFLFQLFFSLTFVISQLCNNFPYGLVMKAWTKKGDENIGH